MIVVTATANKTPGNFGANFLTAIIIAKAKIAIIKVTICVFEAALATVPHTCSYVCSPSPLTTPKILFNCDVPIIIAAALVKPTTTG